MIQSANHHAVAAPPSRSRAWLFFGLALVLLAFAIARDAWPWIADDAFISLRYSDRLLAGEGLTWNDGEYVEGYSNLSWVALSALLGWLGLDLITALRILGMTTTCGALAVLAFGVTARLPAAAGLATLLLAAQPTVALWAIGGLEAPLVMLCVGWAFWSVVAGLASEDHARRQRCFAVAGSVYALLVLTRPDTPLWVAVAASTMVVHRHRVSRGRGRREWWTAFAIVVLPALLMVCAQTGFRLVYYGDWLPNTARIKIAPSMPLFWGGVDYLRDSAHALRSLLVPAAVGALLGWRDRTARPLLFHSLLAVLTWSAYVVTIGGDFFPKNRLFVPALIPLSALAAHGFAAVSRWTRLGPTLAMLMALSSIVWARIDAELPPSSRQALSIWEWNGIAVGQWLDRAFAEQQPLVAVDMAGAVPYASRLPCIDMLGLCDRVIATSPVEEAWRTAIGHSHGNGAYVLSREPDLVLFVPAPHSALPRFSSGTQMEVDPRFIADYRVVTFDVTVASGDIDMTYCQTPLVIISWLRVKGRLGARQVDDRIVVPGYLFGSYRQPYAFRLSSAPLKPEDPGFEAWRDDMLAGMQSIAAMRVIGVRDQATGAVLGEVRAPGRHVLQGLRVPPGRYTIGDLDLPAGVGIEMTAAHGAPLPRDGDGYRVPGSPDEQVSIDLVCVVPASVALPVHIAEVELRRTP